MTTAFAAILLYMKLVLLLISVLVVQGIVKEASAAAERSTLTCNAKVKFVTAGKGRFRTYTAGEYNFPLKEVASLTVLENDKERVRFYPWPAMASVVVDKTYHVKTDEKSYWKLFGPKKELKIACTVKVL